MFAACIILAIIGEVLVITILITADSRSQRYLPIPSLIVACIILGIVCSAVFVRVKQPDTPPDTPQPSAACTCCCCEGDGGVGK